MRRLTYLVIASAIASTTAAQTAAAQTVAAQTAPAPADGASPAAPAAARRPAATPPQTLLLTTTLSEGGADQPAGAVSTPAPGLHTDADVLATYERHDGRARLAATGQSVVRYTAGTGALTSAYDEGAVDFIMRDSRRRFHAAQRVTYSPVYQFGAVPDAEVSALGASAESHGDFANAPVSALTSSSGIDWTQAVSRRTSVSISYDTQRTMFGGGDLTHQSQTGGVRLTRRVSRFIALRTGYVYRLATSSRVGDVTMRNHDLDLGIDYSRALSMSKRTTVSFASGSSLTPTGQGTTFNVTGDAALTRQIGRTWKARVAVNRSVQLLEGFAQPVLANAITTSVTGSISRRATVSSTTGYTAGTVGLAPGGSSAYASWTGGVGVTLSLSRRSACEAQYFWYGQQVDRGVLLVPGLTDGLSRQGVRVNIVWRAPAWH